MCLRSNTHKLTRAYTLKQSVSACPMTCGCLRSSKQVCAEREGAVTNRASETGTWLVSSMTCTCGCPSHDPAPRPLVAPTVQGYHVIPVQRVALRASGLCSPRQVGGPGACVERTRRSQGGGEQWNAVTMGPAKIH